VKKDSTKTTKAKTPRPCTRCGKPLTGEVSNHTLYHPECRPRAVDKCSRNGHKIEVGARWTIGWGRHAEEVEILAIDNQPGVPTKVEIRYVKTQRVDKVIKGRLQLPVAAIPKWAPISEQTRIELLDSLLAVVLARNFYERLSWTSGDGWGLDKDSQHLLRPEMLHALDELLADARRRDDWCPEGCSRRSNPSFHYIAPGLGPQRFRLYCVLKPDPNVVVSNTGRYLHFPGCHLVRDRTMPYIDAADAGQVLNLPWCGNCWPRQVNRRKEDRYVRAGISEAIFRWSENDDDWIQNVRDGWFFFGYVPSPDDD
jgi:hypothetical protein